MSLNSKTYLRDAIREGMDYLGRHNEKVAVVCADVMASCRVNGFFEKYPERSFNTGIAEQDMISFSAGLASEGFVVYAFSMGPFISMRACEQVRTDVAYGRQNVRMIGTYAGLSGGISGATHWTLEDCAIMRGIPGITVLEPSDVRQFVSMIKQSADEEGPVYIRVGIEDVPEIYPENYLFRQGKADVISEGTDGAYICSGVVVKYAIEATEILKTQGKSISVIDMSTIKPIDEKAVLSAAQTGNIVVAQDHNVVGGLGDAVASVLVKNRCDVGFNVLGIPDRFETMAHAPYLYHKFGYDTAGLVEAMKHMIEGG